jgi:hypothetical protein
MKRFLPALAALAGFSGAARAADYSDLWYNPFEPGYGVTVVQQHENAFVTLYVYGADGEPLWLVSPDARIVGYIGELPQFRGTLYRTRGPAFHGPFDPRLVQATAVGTLHLSSTHESVLEVEYDVNEVTVRKQLTRQTFARPDAFTWYAGNFKLRMSLPGGAVIGHREYSADFLFHLDEQGEAVLRVEEPVSGVCEYRGAYHQSGRYGYFSGDFTCTNAPGGAFDVSQLEITDSGITGRMATFNAEIGRGRFGAVRQ